MQGYINCHAVLFSHPVGVLLVQSFIGGFLGKVLLCSLYVADIEGVPVETQYVGHFALHHIKLAVQSMSKFREMPTNTIGPSEVCATSRAT